MYVIPWYLYLTRFTKVWGVVSTIIHLKIGWVPWVHGHLLVHIVPSGSLVRPYVHNQVPASSHLFHLHYAREPHALFSLSRSSLLPTTLDQSSIERKHASCFMLDWTLAHTRLGGVLISHLAKARTEKQPTKSYFTPLDVSPFLKEFFIRKLGQFKRNLSYEKHGCPIGCWWGRPN